MSQPPQGQPPYGPDGEPSGGGWGRQQPGQQQQPGQGWEQPQQPGQGWEQPSGQPLQPGQGWGQQPGQPAPGGYGPPPGQGGWGVPPAPGYGEQPTQLGGFGVPGPPLNGGGPGWGGPGAPGGGGNNKKNMIIIAVAALVLVVVVAVLVALALRGNDEESTTASSSPSTSSSPSSSGGFSSEPSDVADPADFIGQLPADFVDCTDMELEGDGDLAAASCGAALTQPGPQMAAFYLYPDVATLDEVFADDVADQGLTEFATGDSCSAGTGYSEWTYNDGTHGGQLACQLTGDGNVLITWTDDAFLTEGLIQAPGTSQAEVSALYDWWMSVNSEYQN
jgi:hypothetical protein